MLRLSRLARFIVPNSASPELPLFLSTKAHHAEPAVGDVYQKVMDFDRQGIPATTTTTTTAAGVGGAGAASSSPSSTAAGQRRSVTQRYFSGSAMGAVCTAAGVGLFLLTFAYHIGKPVADAHREYFAKLNLTDTSAGDEDEGGDAPSPMEEFDDAVVEEEGES